jgi:hypothetical protein
MSGMTRRPTPALIVAILALIVATGGTAVAQGILIRSPQQLADGVVTGTKLGLSAVTSANVAQDTLNRNDIADAAITNRELSNPVFSAAVDGDGTVSSGQSVNVNQSLTHKIEQVGGGVVYDVGFNQDVSQCVYSATPGKTRRGGSLSPVLLSVEGRASNPNVVTVFVRDLKGSFFQPLRPSFHLLVVC